MRSRQEWIRFGFQVTTTRYLNNMKIADMPRSTRLIRTGLPIRGLLNVMKDEVSGRELRSNRSVLKNILLLHRSISAYIAIKGSICTGIKPERV